MDYNNNNNNGETKQNNGWAAKVAKIPEFILGTPDTSNYMVDEEYDYVDESAYDRGEAKSRRVFGSRQTKKNNNDYNGSVMDVCVIRPVSVDDTREITNTLLDKRAVVLNMEGLDVAIAQRIIDFVSGSCYAIRGNMQKISNFIFLITPSSVSISGDLPEIIGGSFDVPDMQ